jgi:hypothetical protein
MRLSLNCPTGGYGASRYLWTIRASLRGTNRAKDSTDPHPAVGGFLQMAWDSWIGTQIFRAPRSPMQARLGEPAKGLNASPVVVRDLRAPTMRDS